MSNFRPRLLFEYERLKTAKYISLETYKKNGNGVKTPVWFVIKDQIIYVITREKTGKVKRIKNSNKSQLAPCTFRGKILGDWVSGNAKFVDGEEANEAFKLQNKKYGFWAKFGFLTGRKGKEIVISITLINS